MLLTKLGNLIILSGLWALATLPLVTFGAARAALYYGVHKCVRQGSDSPARDFIHAFKDSLRQGVPLSLIYILYGAFAVFDVYAAMHGINGFTLPEWYRIISYLLLLPILLTYPYVFPCLSRFSNTVKGTLKNSFIFCATHLGHTLLLLLIEAAMTAAIVFCPPLALIAPAVSAFLGMQMIENDFRLAMKLDEDEYEARFGMPEDSGEAEK